MKLLKGGGGGGLDAANNNHVLRKGVAVGEWRVNAGEEHSHTHVDLPSVAHTAGARVIAERSTQKFVAC
jgi:hypothetical protein